MVQITYELRARQQTSLTPRLQQSVKLLQMSTLEFSQEVAQAIATNPFLEEPDESSDVASSDDDRSSDSHQPEHENESDFISDVRSNNEPVAEVAQSTADPEPPETIYCEPDANRADQAYSGDYPAPRNADRPDTDIGQWARGQTGLKEMLHENLCGHELSARDRLLVEFIIEALDADGYLRLPFEELAPERGQLVPAPEDIEWETALQLVQHLAAPGLAARTLSECLELQLTALPAATSGKALALRVVAEGLDKLGKCDYAGLSRLLHCDDDAVRQACALIRSLDPRPGGRYVSVDPSCYVVPDIIVRKIGKSWVALPNESAVPRARLHSTYTQLFRQSRYDDRSLMAGALQEARWLIRSLEQRSTTIERVARAIVARQQTFFDYGEIALRPLMLSEIADELGMHESTVSRATSHKYLASPRGIFEFKDFFSRELATRSGGTCSAVSVRALIQEMISAENPQNPLSDVTLAQKLAHEGVVVARRTVSKYRAQIKVPPAESRRAP